MTAFSDIGEGKATDEVLSTLLMRVGRTLVKPNVWSLSEVVRNLSYEPKNKPFLVADPTLPANAEQMLALWPEIYDTAKVMLVELAPCGDPRFDKERNFIGGCFGCKSEDIADFGRVYSSTMHSVGFVEGVVSSLANWKLYALGIQHYAWTDEFLTVSTDERFAHPLRPEEQVPAGTALHTLFCALHMLQWNRCLARAGSYDGVLYRMRLAKERVEIGISEVSQIGLTSAGEELIGGMITWAGNILDISEFV